MTGEGTVVKTYGTKALVRIERKSACSGDCSSCGLCENPVFEVEAENTVGAAAGDTVRLFMPTAKVFLSAFLVYMLPILGIFAVMGFCSILGAPLYVNAILCSLVLIGWVLLIRAYNRKANLKSVITEIIK